MSENGGRALAKCCVEQCKADAMVVGEIDENGGSAFCDTHITDDESRALLSPVLRYFSKSLH
jgi:hypothetical protein